MAWQRMTGSLTLIYVLRLFNGRLTSFVGPNKLYIVISHLATAPYMSRCIAWRSRLR